jgi:hypothetical protein
MIPAVGISTLPKNMRFAMITANLRGGSNVRGSASNKITAITQPNGGGCGLQAAYQHAPQLPID